MLSIENVVGTLMQKNHGPAVSAIIRTNWKGSSPEKARPSSTYFGSMYGRARKLHRDPSEGIPNGPSAPLFISPTRTPEGHKKFYTLRLDAVRATAQQLQAKDLGLLAGRRRHHRILPEPRSLRRVRPQGAQRLFQQPRLATAGFRCSGRSLGPCSRQSSKTSNPAAGTIGGIFGENYRTKRTNRSDRTVCARD
jgi:hypothetical protein